MKKYFFHNFISEDPNLRGIAVSRGNINRLIYSPEPIEGMDLVDLKGGFLLPGFIDTHTHFLHSGLSLSYVCLQGATMSQVLELLKYSPQKGEWKKGYGFDDSLWERALNGEILDRVSKSEKIAVFRSDMHSCVVNKAALDFLEIPSAFLSEETSAGIFRGRAFEWLSARISESINDSERKEAYKKVTQMALSKGITTIHALEGGGAWGTSDIEFLLKKRERGRGEVRIVLYPQVCDTRLVRQWGLSRMGGCLLADGSFGSMTAALQKPYLDGGTGILYFSNRALDALIKKGHLAGFQLAFHALGDRAVKQVVDSYERVLKQYPKNDHRHRIEHCMLSCEKDLERISSLGLHIGVQPVFDHLWGGRGRLYEKRLGRKRAAQVLPLKSMRIKGIFTAGGSDFDVTPLDPMLGIQAAALHTNPDERLTLRDSIALFTSDAARFSFDENKLGSIEENYSADFTVLEKNPYDTPASEIKNIAVLEVFIAGEKVFSSKV